MYGDSMADAMAELRAVRLGAPVYRPKPFAVIRDVRAHKRLDPKDYPAQQAPAKRRRAAAAKRSKERTRTQARVERRMTAVEELRAHGLVNKMSEF